MDPSYNNGAGSRIPQNNPQPKQPMMQQPMMSSQPMMQQPMMSSQPIVSSGMGDVMLDGAPEKKSRKGVVTLIILVILLVFAGIGFFFWQNGTSGGGSPQQQAGNLKENYNSYVNYVLAGDESNNEINLETVNMAQAFFKNLKDATLDAYITKANEKYGVLKQSYDAVESENRQDIAVLKSYYQDYPQIKSLDISEVIKIYEQNGKDRIKTEQAIAENYKMDSIETYLNNYLAAGISYANVLLGIIENADKAGCIKDANLVQGCYVNTIQEGDDFSKKYNDMIGAQNNLYNQAINTMLTIYEVAYSADGGSSE